MVQAWLPVLAMEIKVCKAEVLNCFEATFVCKGHWTVKSKYHD